MPSPLLRFSRRAVTFRQLHAELSPCCYVFSTLCQRVPSSSGKVRAERREEVEAAICRFSAARRGARVRKSAAMRERDDSLICQHTLLIIAARHGAARCASVAREFAPID